MDQVLVVRLKQLRKLELQQLSDQAAEDQRCQAFPSLSSCRYWANLNTTLDGQDQAIVGVCTKPTTQRRGRFCSGRLRARSGCPVCPPAQLCWPSESRVTCLELFGHEEGGDICNPSFACNACLQRLPGFNEAKRRSQCGKATCPKHGAGLGLARRRNHPKLRHVSSEGCEDSHKGVRNAREGRQPSGDGKRDQRACACWSIKYICISILSRVG